MQAHLVRAAGSKAEFLDAVAEALDFPDWSARNWDALADAVADLSWLPAGPHALVWSAPERLRAAAPAGFDIAVEVLGEAALSSAESVRPLSVLLVAG